MSDSIRVVHTGLTDDVSRALIEALNAELSAMYPEPGANHFTLDPEETARGRGAFLVVYRGDVPVGCGAVRLLDAETGELKRMYVSPAERGRGSDACSWSNSKPKPEPSVPGVSFSRPARVNRRLSPCITRRASVGFPCTASTCCLLTQVSVWGRSCRAIPRPGSSDALSGDG